MKKDVLICAVAALTLLTAAYEAASTVPAAPGRTQDPGMPAGKPVLSEPQALGEPQMPALGSSDALAIREAHSDGGYTYWVEQQGQP